MIKVG